LQVDDIAASSSHCRATHLTGKHFKAIEWRAHDDIELVFFVSYILPTEHY